LIGEIHKEKTKLKDKKSKYKKQGNHMANIKFTHGQYKIHAISHFGLKFSFVIFLSPYVRKERASCEKQNGKIKLSVDHILGTKIKDICVNGFLFLRSIQ
jgi:hypothetical protein